MIDTYDENMIKIESFKLCIQSEKSSEKSFIRFSIASITSVLIINIAKLDTTNKLKFLFGNIPNELIVNNIKYIIAFFVILMFYSFLGWGISIIDLNRHPLFKYYSTKKSLAVIIADKWDNFFKCQFMKVNTLIDIIQNILFFVIFILIILFFFI